MHKELGSEIIGELIIECGSSSNPGLAFATSTFHLLISCFVSEYFGILFTNMYPIFPFARYILCLFLPFFDFTSFVFDAILKAFLENASFTKVSSFFFVTLLSISTPILYLTRISAL